MNFRGVFSDLIFKAWLVHWYHIPLHVTLTMIQICIVKKCINMTKPIHCKTIMYFPYKSHNSLQQSTIPTKKLTIKLHYSAFVLFLEYNWKTYSLTRMMAIPGIFGAWKKNKYKLVVLCRIHIKLTLNWVSGYLFWKWSKPFCLLISGRSNQTNYYVLFIIQGATQIFCTIQCRW
jgi:hypothetical protein